MVLFKIHRWHRQQGQASFKAAISQLHILIIRTFCRLCSVVSVLLKMLSDSDCSRSTWGKNAQHCTVAHAQPDIRKAEKKQETAYFCLEESRSWCCSATFVSIHVTVAWQLLSYSCLHCSCHLHVSLADEIQHAWAHCTQSIYNTHWLITLHSQICCRCNKGMFGGLCPSWLLKIRSQIIQHNRQLFTYLWS